MNEVAESLQLYIKMHKPLGDVSVSSIELLRDGNSSNHLNYKISTSGGDFIARVVRPADLLSYPNLADEFTILKLIESYNVGPKVLTVDLEYFQTPVLFEECLVGTLYQDISEATKDVFDASIELMVKTSEIEIDSTQFPFKYSYTTYTTNFRAWDIRMKEIVDSLEKGHFLVDGFYDVIKTATNYLKEKDVILKNSKQEFIYNDVHPGNVFWLPEEKKAKFIDWQKVSVGDPSFMIALFARRFASIWGANKKEFLTKSLTDYSSRKNIENFEELFWSRVFERAVSDMIWSIWASVKKKEDINVTDIQEHKYFNEVQDVLKILGISSHTDQ